MDIETAKVAIRDVIGLDPSIVAAWLFGSVARGDATATSDVDVAILGSSVRTRKGFDYLPLELEEALARRLKRPVQVVDLGGSPDDLVHRVLRDGILVVDRDQARRVSFEVGSRNRYFDMTPVWRQYRTASRTP